LSRLWWQGLPFRSNESSSYCSAGLSERACKPVHQSPRESLLLDNFVSLPV